MARSGSSCTPCDRNCRDLEPGYVNMITGSLRYPIAPDQIAQCPVPLHALVPW